MGVAISIIKNYRKSKLKKILENQRYLIHFIKHEIVTSEVSKRIYKHDLVIKHK